MSSVHLISTASAFMQAISGDAGSHLHFLVSRSWPQAAHIHSYIRVAQS